MQVPPVPTPGCWGLMRFPAVNLSFPAERGGDTPLQIDALL